MFQLWIIGNALATAMSANRQTGKCAAYAATKAALIEAGSTKEPQPMPSECPLGVVDDPLALDRSPVVRCVPKSGRSGLDSERALSARGGNRDK